MKFKNNKEKVKIRIKEDKGYKWITARHNEIVDIPKEKGNFYNFERIEEEVEIKKTKPKKTKKRKKK